MIIVFIQLNKINLVGLDTAMLKPFH